MKFFRIDVSSAYLLVIGFSFSRGIVCPQFEYLTEDKCCPKCDPGTCVKMDCTEFKGTSCDECPDQTYVDVYNGLRICFPCSACSSGPGLKMKTPCTSKRDETCEPLEGFLCTVFTGESCSKSQKHKSCRPGQFISQNGTAFSDTECSDCDSGTFSDGTFTTCREHKQCDGKGSDIKTPGTSSADAECWEDSSPTPTGILVGVFVVLWISGAIVVALFWKIKICQHGIKEFPEEVCCGPTAEFPEEKPLNRRERGKESQKEWLKEILAHYTKEKKIGLGAEGDIAIETVRLREGP